MRNFWKSDSCYERYGVDGTPCSFRRYLSEVEHFCPYLPMHTEGAQLTHEQKQPAQLNENLDGLMNILQGSAHARNYEWIRNRIRGMWHFWVDASRSLSAKQDLNRRNQKRILIHLGLLSKKSGFKIVETSTVGGPLGELLQWSDVISALYVLGHQLTVTSEEEEITTMNNVASPCQVQTNIPWDIIYTDIVGMKQFKSRVSAGYGKFSCMLRIIDSFGTEPAFNRIKYAQEHQHVSEWGMHELNTQQFFTMFPHSPDNSFMGFVVERHLNVTDRKTTKRKNQAVVYGKSEHMWNDKE